MWKIECGKRPALLTGVGAASVSTALFLLAGVAPAATADRAHAPVGPIRRISASTIVNPTWAGYAAAGAAGTFNSVGASWTQPAVNCGTGETSYSSFWTGLDGYNSSTVEQIGTDSDCVNGKATYYAWYELYPKKTVLIGAIGARDPISASVSYAGGGQFTLTVTDTTSGIHFSKTVRDASARLSSAEVIAESPSSNHGPHGALALADFGTISFGGATVNDGTFASANPDELIMEKSGNLEATPTGLSGGAFKVTWQGA